MTTTSEFQVEPDYYTTLEECSKKRNYPQTNPRYKSFNQVHFTAGDEEQFQQYRGMYNGSVCIDNIPMSQNIYKDLDLKLWSGYKDLSATSVDVTFQYIFNKFKKGIFVKIVSNQVKVFLPFSKHGFINEWHKNIKIDPKYGSFSKMIEYTYHGEGRKNFNPNRVNSNPAEWYGNNCLIRYENPISEGDSNVDNVKTLLEEVCKYRKIPDMEFFVNRRDFPIITKDGTEPYHHLWGSDKIPLVSHISEKYTPVFSMCVTDRYADILMPTWEDWARIQSYDSKFFSGQCKSYNEKFDTPWKNKKPTAVFRGSTTGCGVDIKTNPRLMVSYMSAVQKPSKDGIPYLDAGITKWNLRPRKLQGEQYLRTIEKEKLGFDKVGWLTPKEQSQYKYLINIDGHVTAYRLSFELSMGSVVLLVDSPWKVWYRHMLKPYEHYVPIKANLSDLISQIEWCRNNDAKCEQIAKNALDFFNKYLQKDSVLDYMQKVLVDVKNQVGIYLYNIHTPLTTMIMTEEKYLKPVYPHIDKDVDQLAKFPDFMYRCYGLLQGIQYVVNRVISESDFFKVAKYKRELFKNKLGNVHLFALADIYCVGKETKEHQKSKEHIHEAFVGISSINKLCQYYPNFAYTYGMLKEDETIFVFTEYINGPTLFDYIQGKDFDMNEFLMILIQILLALHVAQNTCGFVHYDLAPWNIMLLDHKNPVSASYPITSNKAFNIRYHITPVLIDYGKSHVIHKQEHHGFINMFKMSTCQDMVNLLITSVSNILEEKGTFRTGASKGNLSQKDTNTLYYLINFLSKTDYLPEPFKVGSYDDELYKFLKNARKYANMIANNKSQLEKLTPYDLFLYILQKKGDYPLIATEITTNPEKLTFPMNIGNARQVYEYAFSQNNRERMETYSNCCIRLKHCTLPQPNNLLFLYYTAQSIHTNLLSLMEDLKYFADKYEIKDSQTHIDMVQDTIVFIEKMYTNLIRKSSDTELEYKLTGSYEKLIPAEYTELSFLEPNFILDQLDKYKVKCDDLTEYKNIIQHILLSDDTIFSVKPNDRKYYSKHLDTLLSVNSVNMQNSCANTNTLRFLATEIYLKDSKEIWEKIRSNIGDDCSKVKSYVDIYIKILEKIQ